MCSKKKSKTKKGGECSVHARRGIYRSTVSFLQRAGVSIVQPFPFCLVIFETASLRMRVQMLALYTTKSDARMDVEHC